MANYSRQPVDDYCDNSADFELRFALCSQGNKKLSTENKSGSHDSIQTKIDKSHEKVGVLNINIAQCRFVFVMMSAVCQPAANTKIIRV